MNESVESIPRVPAGPGRQAAPTGLALIGPEGCILGINPEFCQVLGYSGPDPVGRPLSDLFAPLDQAQEIRSALEGMAHGEPVELETWCRRKGEAPVVINLLAAPIDLGHRQGGWYCLVRDTTDQMLVGEENARALSLLQAT